MAVTDRDGCCLQVSVEHDPELMHWMMKEKKSHSARELYAEISQNYWAHTNCCFVSTALGGVFKYFSFSKPSRLGQLKKKKEENQNSISNPNTIVLDKRFGPVYVEQCMTSWQLQPSVWCERAHSNMHRTVCKTHRRDHKICSFSVVDVSLTPAWSGAIGSYKGLHSRLAACANCSHFSCLWT